MDKLTKNILEELSKSKSNLAELNMPLGLIVPRADTLLTIHSALNGTSINASIDEYFKDGLNSYLKKMNKLKLLGRSGNVVSPISYICRFNNLKIDYYWIPKNACTFFKKNLSLIDESKNKEAVDDNNTPKDKFHESIQIKYGMKMSEYIDDDKNYKKITIIRNPIERVVSCYIDKFAKPCNKGKEYEPYIKNIINNIYTFFNISAVAEDRSVTFAEFLNFICAMPSFSSNEHWRPQADFIRNIKFDYIFKQENLMQDASGVDLLHSSIQKRLNSSVGLTYTSEAFNGEFSETLPRDLNLESLKDYSEFITSSNRLLLEKIYAEDIEMYHYAK